MIIRSFSDISHIILNIYAVLCFGIFTHSNIANAKDELSFDPKLEDAKISFLLKAVKSSKAVFIRNGSEHTCLEAADHLETKMKRARRTFGFFGDLKPIEAKTFINKIASQSSMSGKPYQIKLPDGKIMNTKEWLDLKLQEFEK